MAFGRSNSLSLNTGAVNSSFAAQQSQPQQSGGLFGSAASQPQQSGGLFGSTQTSQPQQSGGLFGSTQTSQPQQSGGLFGSTQTSQPQQAGSSLFGGGQTQTSQPQNSGSTFGGSLFGQQPQNQTQQNAQQTSGASGGGLFGGSLFGSTQQNQNQQSSQPQQQQPAGGSLFGNSSFNNNQQNQQQNQQQQQQQQQQPLGGSLFGGGGSLFGTQQNNTSSMNFSQPQQQPNTSIFGSLASSTNRPAPNPAASQPSLLATARHNQSQYQPFVTGRLTLGQGSAQPQTSTGNPATKLDWNTCRPTTRFSDLTDEAKAALEVVEKLVREQEDLCRQIEAFVPSHETSVSTVAPDVRLVTDKLSDVENALSSDAHGVQQDKDLTTRDEKDLARCHRITTNLSLGPTAHYHPATQNAGAPAWDPDYDTDLINNYFHPLVTEMGKLVDVYNSNLAEIENHVGTIEQSTVLQAQGLRAQRGGLGSRRGSAENVRELADTLRGFEASILAAAGQVGSAREGVNELVMGRHGGALGRRY